MFKFILLAVVLSACASSESNIERKIVEVCRNKDTGKFVKCP